MDIYVGNLSKKITKEDLQKAFEKFGQVSTIKLKKDLFTGEPKGYAFVVMTVQTEAEAAIEGLDGKKIKGTEIKVNRARSHDYKQNAGKKKGRPF
jgi:RNA recognition motif-containing protein